ncbi:MAG: Holliday junction branch migration protein RuvA [Planctomycetota bacterium]|nr:Holliday junction branch migration protein RuvA [Planctomycetota bacterium]
MFYCFRGRLAAKPSGCAVVEAGGVGYLLKVSASTYERLPHVGGEVELFAHLHVTQDSFSLFGFETEGERDFFLKLIGVSGVGPGIAMALLSGCDWRNARDAVLRGDVAFLKKVKGIGDKTAKRIVLELKGALEPGPGGAAGLAAPLPSALDEDGETAVAALQKLQQVGRDDAVAAVLRARREARGPLTVQQLIAAALPYTR